MRLDDRENRTLSADRSELRSVTEDGVIRFRGSGAVFDVVSDEMIFGEETISPGAFTKTLGEADIRSLWNHDSNWPLGRNKSDTLRLEQTSKALLYEVDAPDTQWARDLAVSIERRDVSQSSFGFRVVKDEWLVDTEKDIDRRRLIELHLYDVGPVTFPAYPQTDVAVRSMLRFYGAKDEEIEQLAGDLAALRDPDLTRAQYRQRFDPITRELRSRQTEPGQTTHSGKTPPSPAAERRRRELDLMGID